MYNIYDIYNTVYIIYTGGGQNKVAILNIVILV